MSGKGKPKGKRKSKDKKEKDPNKMGQVDKAFYELTIADLNQKLQTQRCTLIHLEEDHAALTEKLRSLEEDRVDVAAHLERKLIDRNNRITDLEQKLEEISKVRDEENRRSSESIKNLEAKYKAMHDQLTSEIKLLNGKLNSLDEFRIQRDVMMAKFEDQEQSKDEKENSYRMIIYDMEQQQVVERNTLKKEVEARLFQVSEDFTRSNEIRNAGYTRRLIRENIALQKEIDSVLEAQISAHHHLKEKEEHEQKMREEFDSLREIRDQMILSGQHKMMVIEKLTAQYKQIQMQLVKTIKYRDLYEKLVSRDVCDRFTIKDLQRKIRSLADIIDSLKRDKNQMAALQISHDNEIKRLRNTIDAIKMSLQAAISDAEGKSLRVLKHEKTIELTADLDPEKRKSLLKELVHIFATHSTTFAETPSAMTISEGATPIYETGRLGLLRSSQSNILDTFRHPVDPAARKGTPVYGLRNRDSFVIPKERRNLNFILDVEIGDPFYCSSSKDDLDDMEAVADQAEEGAPEEQESSDTQSSVSQAQTETQQQEPIKPSSQKSSALTKLTQAKSATKDEGAASSNYDADDQQEDDGEEEDFVQFFY